MSVRSVTIFALVLALAGCKAERGVAPALPVTTLQVAGDAGESGARYTASIRPATQVDLAFKVGGYVESLLQVRGVDGRLRDLQDGDFVRRGTVLTKVRERELGDALAQARASLAQARADFDRVSRLYENQSVSKADYDAAYARYTASRAQEDQAAQTLADCSLRAPLDGVVLRRSVEVGTLVGAGTPVISVGDLQSVEVVFGVPDVQVDAMRLGAAQTVHVEAVPGHVFAGRITRVAHAADPTSRVFEVEVTLPNRDGALKSGMIAWLELSGTGGAAGAFVPLNAIVRPPGDPRGYAVFVADHADGGDVARLRPVTLGEIRGDRIQVTGGLRAGENVIVRGATLAVDAQPIRIVP